MKLKIQSPTDAIRASDSKFAPMAHEIEAFADELRDYVGSVSSPEHEIHYRDPLKLILHRNFYHTDYYINTKFHQDLSIFLGSGNTSPVGVIFETKAPGSVEMICSDRVNVKAVHELVYYYFEEVIGRQNFQLKHLVATDFLDFCVFDANTFDRHFFRNTTIKKLYDTTINDRKGKEWFYRQLAQLIDSLDDELPCVYFSVRKAERLSKTELKAIFNVFSPQFLIKKRPAIDSNALNRPFYDELLHIIGLAEKKDGKKIKIVRLDEKNRNPGSLLELAISKLATMFHSYHSREIIDAYGSSDEERIEQIAFELCLTWMNRILFLKLLESQLTHFHPGKKEYKFLNVERVSDFNQLWNLFHEVLAKPTLERNPRYSDRFNLVPYLNSSLFEMTELEAVTTRITELDDGVILPFANRTVLKRRAAEKTSLPTLSYLFEFLDAYDYTSVTRDQLEIADDRLINASILGKIFEKINGYREGSIYTPGFITMYMCREAIRPAIVRKFNELEHWNFHSFEGLQNRLGRFHEPSDILRFNNVVDNIRICDPAVGSGHFLVSALNELILIKHELGILADTNGRTLSDIHITIEDDELRITRTNGDPFRYEVVRARPDPAVQRIQRALFHEKEKLIENCLFGVDINPNSVKICQLRLWIELLKHSYYRDESNFAELETLPNIDINIKQGNSLLFRSPLQEPFTTPEARQWRQEYAADVHLYKETRDKTVKERLRKHIAEIQAKFAKQLPDEADPLRKQLERQDAIIHDNKYMDPRLNIRTPEEKEMRIARAEADKVKIKRQIEAIDRKYDMAFEWRFGFPEVLDDEGNFSGFDVVIGNPPYIRQEELSGGTFKSYLKSRYTVFSATGDILIYFYELGVRLLRPGGNLSLITANKFMKANFGAALRSFLAGKLLTDVIDFGDAPVFDGVVTYPSIVNLQNLPAPDGHTVDALTFPADEVVSAFETVYQRRKLSIPIASLNREVWRLENTAVLDLVEKLKRSGRALGKIVDGKVFRGVISGLTEAFVINATTSQRLINADPKCEDLIVPFLRGRDVKRWETNFEDQFLIKIESSGNVPHPWSKLHGAAAEEKFAETFPSIYEHFLPFRDRLIKRDDQGYFFWELRACAYWGEFWKPKIIYPDIYEHQSFAFDDKGLCAANTCYFIPTESKWLLAFLNSKVVEFFYAHLSMKMRGGYLRAFTEYIERIPIPIVPDEIQDRLHSLANAAIDGRDRSLIEAEIDDLIYQLYGLTDDEIALVGKIR